MRFTPRTLLITFIAVALGTAAFAQQPPVLPSVVIPNRTTSLTDQLVSRLKATTDERRSFIRFVVGQVSQQRLDAKLVIAVERYAIRRNPSFPFPFFERAIRVEAGKRGVVLPPSRQFATSATPRF